MKRTWLLMTARCMGVFPMPLRALTLAPYLSNNLTCPSIPTLLAYGEVGVVWCGMVWRGVVSVAWCGVVWLVWSGSVCMNFE